ncbi:hypothetical protein BHM03_00027947 [Ensete ventricosum]|uniref:Uncharacterized protein n=1 Tax=Ensete ventricosum TaxID=4639 RepID=A0A445MHN7_ENSVE|nr:hypothetical protein BHM03_00027947 [Ensete ventricosum]
MGASGSSDGVAGSLPLDRERDSPSPRRDLCFLVSTFTPYLRPAQNPLQSTDQDGLLLGYVWGGITDRVSRPIKPKPQNQTTNIKVAGLPTFVTGRRPADSKTDPGGKLIIAPTLVDAKARHEQIPSLDNPGSSALAQEDDKVAPRVERYLAGRDSPPPQAFLDEWVQRKPEADLQSIHRDSHTGSVQAIRALPGLRNMQPVFSRDAIPLSNHGK